MTTVERIKQLADYESIKITTLEREIGASKGVLSRAINNNTDIQSKWVSKIVENYPHFNPAWILTGKGDMIVEEKSLTIIQEDEIPKGAVPFWNLPVSAGHSVKDIIGSTKPSGYIKDLPGIEIAEHILPVTGMSMEPEISNGAIIGVRRIDNWDTLNTERIYLIITSDDRMVKRIEPDMENEDILWCISPNYHRFKIYKSDIIEIQRVCFVYNPK